MSTSTPVPSPASAPAPGDGLSSSESPVVQTRRQRRHLPTGDIVPTLPIVVTHENAPVDVTPPRRPILAASAVPGPLHRETAAFVKVEFTPPPRPVPAERPVFVPSPSPISDLLTLPTVATREPNAASTVPLLPAMSSPDTEQAKLCVPSRFDGSRRRAERTHAPCHWSRGVRFFVTIAATAMVSTAALPAYAADPTQYVVVGPTTLVSIHTDPAAQTYTADGGAQADLSRDDVSLQSAASAAPASKTLTTACTVDGTDMSGSVVYPLPNEAYHLTSGIGYRYIASLGRADYHTGQDFAAPETTSIFSIADGTVADVGVTDGATYIKIKSTLASGEKVDFYYVHEYPDGVFVKVGQTVTAGEKIAEVGNSGISTGSHLHLEVHDATDGDTEVAQRSTLLDPLKWLTAHGAVSAGAC